MTDKFNLMYKDYIFHSLTQSVCPVCLAVLSAKVIIKDNRVYISRNCPDHGEMISLLEEDASYYLNRYSFDKPGTKSKVNTPVLKGCPYDCGLCLSHEQHTCIGLIEVTDNCDLNCPVCYANGRSNSAFLDLHTISKMMDFYQDSENQKAEILQISGGEPTTHPEIIKIIELARSKRFKYVMINTNGLRISADTRFLETLSRFKSGFEVYLQFDGFLAETHNHLRGRDLNLIKKQAVKNLSDYKIPMTIVTSVQKGINDKELGDIVKFAMTTKYVRGINFQPVSYFGRIKLPYTDDRITLTGILRRIEKQTQSMVKFDDFIPLPCNVDRVAVNYMYREGEKFMPLARNTKIKKHLPYIKNTFAFDIEDVLKQTAQGLLRGEVCECLSFLKDFLPKSALFNTLKSKQKKVDYVNENTFRISVTSFVDKYNCDLKALKKECVHIITPDLRRIPFSAYNMFYREKNEK
ncbi:MAG: radical SAM protein [Candidatus Omnitrophica bacterium]|nr:radical SAM protein [Candidatus Omnitrophota bacterium]